MLPDRISWIALLVLLIAALPASAQPLQWERAGGSLGLGTIDGIVSTHGGVLFTWSRNNGIYRSIDEGGRWEHVVSG